MRGRKQLPTPETYKAPPRPFLRSSLAAAVFPGQNSQAVDVADFGAVGDGVTDDTIAFQKALDAAASMGGAFVFAKAAVYRFNGSLAIRNATTLQGVGAAPSAHPVGQQPFPLIGTVFAVHGGRGSETGNAFLSIYDDCTLRGVTLIYPDQIPTEMPQPYPWSITMIGTNGAVTDVEILNSWNGIQAVGAPRHFIARVQGQPINIGIYVDQTYDIGRIEDVHFNPWYSPNKDFMKAQLTFGRAFVIARSDWEYVFNTFAFGYNIGYHFIASPDGACNGNFLGIGADLSTNRSVLVEQADNFGILITNGEFTAFTGDWIEGDFHSMQVEIAASNTGAVRFVNSAFWGPSEQIALIAGTGTAGFDSCTLSFWGGLFGNETNYAIDALGGTLLVNSCDFQHDGNQVFVGKAVSKAVVTSNSLVGKKRIYVEGKRSVGIEIANNAATV